MSALQIQVFVCYPKELYLLGHAMVKNIHESVAKHIRSLPKSAITQSKLRTPFTVDMLALDTDDGESFTLVSHIYRMEGLAACLVTGADYPSARAQGILQQALQETHREELKEDQARTPVYLEKLLVIARTPILDPLRKLQMDIDNVKEVHNLDVHH